MSNSNAQPHDKRSAPPSRKDLVASLQSRTCPACRGMKQRHHTFCRACYHALPRQMRTALYSRLGSGYEQAVAAAMQQLGVEQMHLPPEHTF